MLIFILIVLLQYKLYFYSYILNTQVILSINTVANLSSDSETVKVKGASC